MISVKRKVVRRAKNLNDLLPNIEGYYNIFRYTSFDDCAECVGIYKDRKEAEETLKKLKTDPTFKGYIKEFTVRPLTIKTEDQRKVMSFLSHFITNYPNDSFCNEAKDLYYKFHELGFKEK